MLLVVRDSPEARHVRGPSTSPRALVGGLVEAWRLPGTRLGFWVHFCTPFSANLLTMLWGYPFFVKGEGRTPGEAGLLLVADGAHLHRRRPGHRLVRRQPPLAPLHDRR